MSARLLLASVAAAAFLTFSTQSHAAEIELFAPSVISTPRFEYALTVSTDGKTAYFARGDAGFNRLTILVSRLVNGQWQAPTVAPFSGIWKDTDPVFSRDGRRLYFISNRPVEGDKARPDYDLWYVERNASDEWFEPKHMPAPINSDANEASASEAADGSFYFESSRPASAGGNHIYRSARIGGEYQEPGLIVIPGKGTEFNPFVSPDQRFIIFASNNRGGSGSGDLFYTLRRADGSWSEPVNLPGGINTPFNENSPYLSADGRKLYFSSNRISGSLIRPRPATIKDLEREASEIENGLPNLYVTDLNL